MNNRLIAILAGTATLAAAAPASAATPGTYRGETEQGQSITLVVKGARGSGLRIERIKVSAGLTCPDGSADDVSVNRIVIGGQVKKNGRFRIRMSDLDLSGRFTSKQRVTGSFDVREFDCASDGIGYSAKRR
jgi:hypothetical protein